MMRIDTFVLFSLVSVALSGPAKRDCGKEKCWEDVKCGTTYGGCWTECADGLTAMPTFTAPLCTSNAYAEPHAPVSKTDSLTDLASSTSDSAEYLVTPPPTPSTTTGQSLSMTSSCSPLWLCIDHEAVCGDESQWYGGCYDVCTSSPPVTSPSCSLSSATTELGYAVPTSSQRPGSAYTENSAPNSISAATDDRKALVMAEMPNVDAPGPEPAASSPAVEFRLANADAAEPATGSSSPVEAPANLRGAAIAKMQADTVREPNTDNVPCWDSPTCKEVQLGIPSPIPSQTAAETSAAPTADASSPAPENAPAGAPTDAPTDAPTAESTEIPA